MGSVFWRAPSFGKGTGVGVFEGLDSKVGRLSGLAGQLQVLSAKSACMHIPCAVFPPHCAAPSLQGFLTALDWARGSAISEPAGREGSVSPRAASQLIKDTGLLGPLEPHLRYLAGRWRAGWTRRPAFSPSHPHH